MDFFPTAPVGMVYCGNVEMGAKRKAAVKERKEGQLERTASGIRHVVPCKAELHQSGLSSPSVPFAK